MALQGAKSGQGQSPGRSDGRGLYNWYTKGELKAEGTSITEGIGQGRITANLEELQSIMPTRFPTRKLCRSSSSCQARRPVPRRLDRHQRRRRDPHGRKLGPGHTIVTILVRRRQPLPEQTVQPRLSAREEPACPRVAGLTSMSYANPRALVSTEWLAGHLHKPGLRVVDASWFFPNSGKTGRGEFEREHIPGAVFFDIDEIAAPHRGLPHMLPEARRFATRVSALGLGNGNRIVIYDRVGGGSAAARVWWMFRSSAMTMPRCSTAAWRNGLPRRNRSTPNYSRRATAPSSRSGAKVWCATRLRSKRISRAPPNRSSMRARAAASPDPGSEAA